MENASQRHPFQAHNGISGKEVPTPIALTILAGLILMIAALNNPAGTKHLFYISSCLIEKYQNWVIIVFVCTTLNLGWIVSIAKRSLGLQKQGSRLQALSESSNKESKVSLKYIAISLSATAGFYLISHLFSPSKGLYLCEISATHQKYLFEFSRISISTLVMISLVGLGNLKVFKYLSHFRKRRLPSYPIFPNSLNLGTINEEDIDKSPEWVTLFQKALSGNILITGSPGSGKTQAAILTFFEQIVDRFQPFPSILAIDPKGTYIAEALKMLEKKNLTDRILHLRLGGKVRINPIYQEKSLKNAGFLKMAYMLQAVAVNLMGKSSNTDFWEVSSFNFIKNGLIYCAAVHGYYTLKDLYSTLVKSAHEDLALDLQECLTSDKFDEEEKYNIAAAREYFSREFQQLADEVRTGILATSTSLLNQFQEYQAAQIFCPPQDEITVGSIDEIIDQGKIILFDVANPALAVSMGTLIKLYYQQSVLNGLTDLNRSKAANAVIIVDEYQDVVTTGGGSTLGDDRYLAKSREAKGIFIGATQSLSSLQNSIGDAKATGELIQNFRTRIVCHSSDKETVDNIQHIAGTRKEEILSRGFSENSRSPVRNYLLGGFDAPDANLSETINTQIRDEQIVKNQDISSLKTFESFALIYDGIETKFHKLFLKPYFLQKKNILHKDILKNMGDSALLKARALAGFLLILGWASSGMSFPNVCTAVKAPEFNSCLDFQTSNCTCGPIPHPCACVSYYVPQTFIEVLPGSQMSFFTTLPTTKLQLSSVLKDSTPFGAVGDFDTQSFHAHTIPVPFTSLLFSLLPCGTHSIDALCFSSMSEHYGEHWHTGKSDMLQPKFLAWSAAPKACMLKGASGALAKEDFSYRPGAPICSYQVPALKMYPPSQHEVCNGWGVFYPRYGSANTPSATAGSLMIASRIKSLGAEVQQSVPQSPDEKWQMLWPQTSSCFREGQSAAFLETVNHAIEIGRLSKPLNGSYLYVIWSKTSCTAEWPTVPAYQAMIGAMKPICQGIGDL